MNHRIGSVAASTKGRLMLILRRLSVEIFWSYWHQYRGSSFSFRSRAAFFLRMAGGYVSLSERMAKMVAPAMMRLTQFVHLHPLYWKIKPPIRGPKTGPLSGAMLYMDIPRERYSGLLMSTTVPGVFEIITAPKRAL